jgi:hypothetical protein
MIFNTDGSVRLTPAELNGLRRANAKNGVALNDVRTRDELLAATLDGLPPEIQADLLAFLDTPPLTGDRHRPP